MQHTCNRNPTLISDPKFSQVSTLPQVSCHQSFRWQWFIFWFALVPLLGTTLAAASNKAHPGWAAPMLGLTAIAATLSMAATNLSLNNVDAFYQTGGAILARARTMFAGFLILSAGLLLLLFGLGAAMQGRGEEEEEAGSGGKRGYERGGGGGGYGQGQPSQPTVTYGAPTGAAGEGATRTAQGTPGPAV